MFGILAALFLGAVVVGVSSQSSQRRRRLIGGRTKKAGAGPKKETKTKAGGGAPAHRGSGTERWMRWEVDMVVDSRPTKTGEPKALDYLLGIGFSDTYWYTPARMVTAKEIVAVPYDRQWLRGEFFVEPWTKDVGTGPVQIAEGHWGPSCRRMTWPKQSIEGGMDLTPASSVVSEQLTEEQAKLCGFAVPGGTTSVQLGVVDTGIEYLVMMTAGPAMGSYRRITGWIEIGFDELS